MLDAEADEIANAAKLPGERKAYRAGHYDRALTAKAGRLALKEPKLKGAVFDPRSSNDTGDARRVSRRPSSTCTWPA